MNIFQQLCQHIALTQPLDWDQWDQLDPRQQSALLSVMREVNHAPTMMSYFYHHVAQINWEAWGEASYQLPLNISLDEIDHMYHELLEHTPLKWGKFVDVVFHSMKEQGRVDLLIWLLEEPNVECAHCGWNQQRTAKLSGLLSHSLQRFDQPNYQAIAEECVQEFVEKPELLARDNLQHRLAVLLNKLIKGTELPSLLIPVIDQIARKHRSEELQAWRQKQELLTHTGSGGKVRMGKKM